MQFKLLFVGLMSLLVTQVFSNNFQQSKFSDPQTTFFVGDGCEIPAPETFHVVETGSSWVKFQWTPEFIIPPLYRLKTYEQSTNILVNVTDVLGSESIARVQGLQFGVTYRTDIHAVCEDGTENPNPESAFFPILIQELVVTGFSASVPPEYCRLSSAGVSCPVQFANGYVNVFQFENKSAENGFIFSRMFYVDKVAPDKIRIRINPNENGSGVSFQCMSSNFTYTLPNNTCQAYQVAIIRLGVELCRFEVSMSNTGTSGAVHCTLMATSGKNSIIHYYLTPGFGETDNRSNDLVEILTNEPLISPNPFTDHLNIQLPTLTPETPVNLALYDLQGRLVATQFGRDDNQMYTLPTENLKPGMYFLRIEAGGEVSTTKVVKTQ